MSDLIIVHDNYDNHEYLLNRDQIVFAESLEEGLTSVALTNGKNLTIKETLAVLRNRHAQ